MPEKTTAPWGLPYPTSAGEVKLGATDFEELATTLNTLFNAKFPVVKKWNANANLTAGELACQEKNGATFTLPAAAPANQEIGVYCFGTECKVTTTGGAVFYGDFVTSNPGTLVLLEKQHVKLASDGTNWAIVAGEPRREQAWEGSVARAEATPLTPSAAREVEVMLRVSCSGGAGAAYPKVGGVTLQPASIASGSQQIWTFRVPAGVAWEWLKSAGVTVEGFSNYRTL